jgi:hypothetical protein
VNTGKRVFRRGEKVLVIWSEIVIKIISWMLSSESQLHKSDTDIRVKEPTLESLTKKKKEYQPPRFMSVREAAGQLLEIIRRKDGDCKELGMLQTPCVSSTENAFDNQLIISAFPS